MEKPTPPEPHSTEAEKAAYAAANAAYIEWLAANPQAEAEASPARPGDD